MEIDKSISVLFSDICTVVENARAHLAITANQTLTLITGKLENELTAIYWMASVQLMENKLCRSWRQNSKYYT